MSTAIAVTTLGQTDQLTCQDGALVWWSASCGSAQQPAGRVPMAEVVFILTSPKGVYKIYSLSEDISSRLGTKYDGTRVTRAFQLSVLSTRTLPETHLDHLVLRCAPKNLHRPLHVVVSTGSGTGKAAAVFEHVLQPLLEAVGLSQEKYSVMITTSPDSVRELARGLKGGSTVVLLSGDGAVSDLLNSEEGGVKNEDGQEEPITMALLPLGTGNALFHSLHRNNMQACPSQSQPSELVTALHTLFVTGSPIQLPTFTVSFSPPGTIVHVDGKGQEVDRLEGAIVASYGFHASLVWASDTPSHRKHGAERFGMAAKELLGEAHGYDCSVEALRADQTWESLQPPTAGPRFGYVLATTASRLERTFVISPASQPGDAVLRLVWFGALSGEKTMEVMRGAYAGGMHVEMMEEGEGRMLVGYDTVEGVRITVREGEARWRKACVDGAIVEVPEGGRMEVRREGGRGKFRVLVRP